MVKEYFTLWNRNQTLALSVLWLVFTLLAGRVIWVTLLDHSLQHIFHYSVMGLVVIVVTTIVAIWHFKTAVDLFRHGTLRTPITYRGY